jgi:hypothetical protein
MQEIKRAKDEQWGRGREFFSGHIERVRFYWRNGRE